MERKHLTKRSENVLDSENKSLREKLRSHYKKDKSKDFQARVEAWTEYLTQLPVPIPLLVIALTVGWYYGVTEIVPVLYGEYGPVVEYLQVSLGVFLTWQIVVFWCGIRFVDSSLKTYTTIAQQPQRFADSSFKTSNLTNKLKTKLPEASGVSNGISRMNVSDGISRMNDKMDSSLGMISEYQNDSKDHNIAMSEANGVSNDISRMNVSNDISRMQYRMDNSYGMISKFQNDSKDHDLDSVSGHKCHTRRTLESNNTSKGVSGFQSDTESHNSLQDDNEQLNGSYKERSPENGWINEIEGNTEFQDLATESVSRHDEREHVYHCKTSLENGRQQVYQCETSLENGRIADGLMNSSLWVCNSNDMDASTSYWRSGYCFICNDVKPPRCHHCRICNTCILKRDHHCYFTGACVGWRNQRYFIVFCFWASLSCTYASVHLLFFIHKTLWSSLQYVDMFAPCAVARYFLGYTSHHVVIYVILTSFISYLAVISTRFLLEHLFLVVRGRTTFENNCMIKGMGCIDTRTVNDKFRSVFGNYWLLNWIVPTHNFFPPVEDPVNWPAIKTY